MKTVSDLDRTLRDLLKSLDFIDSATPEDESLKEIFREAQHVHTRIMELRGDLKGIGRDLQKIEESSELIGVVRVGVSEINGITRRIMEIEGMIPELIIT